MSHRRRRSRRDDETTSLEPSFDDPHAHALGLSRKDAQLCAQALDALSLALARTLDDALDGAWICDVTPSPHVGHLRVVVVAAPGADLGEVARALESRSGALRSEVAGAIHRKKTPTLSFAVLPTPVGTDDVR